MTDVLNTVAPVFGLIILGWISARIGLLDEAADRGLASFVFTIAMPALLFRTMATVRMPEGSSVDLLIAFMGSAAITWCAATLATTALLARPRPDSASIGMGATFGNTVMMGIPLAVGHYGEAAVGPLAVVVAVHAPVMWIIATLQNEALRSNSAASQEIATRNKVDVVRGLVGDLARNPILIGIIAGSIWRTTGLEIPETPDKIISYLAAAGIPGALFALGLSLAKYRITGQGATLVTMTVLKLLVMPLAAWAIGALVLDLPPLWLGVAVILAAVPTGANAFLFASRYDSAVASVSGTVALSTLLSMITITALLSVLPR
ncbi:MAG: AEC family transporter [Pseudomonadota bacterium]